MERWEMFLRIFSDHEAAAAENNLTPRCWKPWALYREIQAIIKANRSELKSTFPTSRLVVEHLKRIGWLRVIKTQTSDATKELKFLFLGAEAGASEPIYPLELLQSWLPDGVICFFSAIGYYELTTQMVTHHHIARLTPPKEKAIVEPAVKSNGESPSKAVERDPLGTIAFHFEDVAYYHNKRDRSLTPGIQLRVASPKCWLRITTLEQTLLDGLMQPVRCGGEAVVLEAWQNGVQNMDADRLAQHLGKIQREDLDRRVGAMLEMLDAGESSKTLDERLREVREKQALQPAPEIPLLTGLGFSETNSTWGVRVP